MGVDVPFSRAYPHPQRQVRPFYPGLPSYTCLLFYSVSKHVYCSGAERHERGHDGRSPTEHTASTMPTVTASLTTTAATRSRTSTLVIPSACPLSVVNSSQVSTSRPSTASSPTQLLWA